jgi:predicted nicotinamide N-methyase
MPGYTTKQEVIAVDGVGDLIIRSLLDRQQYADPLGEADLLGISSAAWPLFGLLWPSGVELAARLALRPVRVGERILELGCGLALASLVGHRRGADVTASDCHPLAAAFLLENLRLNSLAPMKYRHGHWSAAVAAGPAASLLRPTVVSGLYDLIIGSDLLYERDLGPVLATYIARHLAPGGEVWVIDPNRGNRPAFHRHMALHGFERREELLSRPATDIVLAYKGRVLIYQRDTAPTAPGL